MVMLALRGYSNGRYVIPRDNVEIPESSEVIITFLDELIIFIPKAYYSAIALRPFYI